MKKSIFALSIALCASGAFAQTITSATQVCQRIASVNGTNGANCAQLISRNNFEPAVLSLAYKAVPQGSATALEIMRTGANRRLTQEAGALCEQFLSVNAQNSIACLNATLDTFPAPELLRISSRLIPQGSSYAVSALQAGANAYFFSPLADICEAMASVNASNTVRCVQTIANKVSMNGAEQVCRSALTQGSSYALSCVEGIVMDYTPIPQPTTIMVQEYLVQDLRKAVLKTRSLLDRNMIDNARKSVDEAVMIIDQMLTR
jgi:hypothetical protein